MVRLDDYFEDMVPDHPDVRELTSPTREAIDHDGEPYTLPVIKEPPFPRAYENRTRDADQG